MTSTTDPIVHVRDEFSGSESTDGFWRSIDADTVMQRGNHCAFEAMADIEADALDGATVVDIGCNMGGFLRFLCDHYTVSRAFGLDPATSTIQRAGELSGDRRIEYAAASRPPQEWPQADVAFSQEVMYLIDDLAEHADDMWKLLRPGGRYVAVTSVHAQSQLMAPWHAANAESLELPPLRRVEEYIIPFLERGFTVEVSHLKVRAVPIDEDLLDRTWQLLQFWTRTNEKVVFRFRRNDEPNDSRVP
jgi:SAM-dependent methyltransferase